MIDFTKTITKETPEVQITLPPIWKQLCLSGPLGVQTAGG